MYPPLKFMWFELRRTRKTIRRDQDENDLQLNGVLRVFTDFESVGRTKNQPTKHMTKLMGIVTKKMARQE